MDDGRAILPEFNRGQAPGDAHRPGLRLDGPHASRKAVVKVSVAYQDRQRAVAAR
jgi:hypothetical protein